MPRPLPEPVLRVSNFEVVIGRREIGFAAVGPLSSEQTFAADADQPIDRFAPIVLRRALTTSSELYDWRRAVAAGKDDARDVRIRQLATPGGAVVNEWRLVRARPLRWTGPSFDALCGDVAFEELELVYEDLLWVQPTTTTGRSHAARLPR